MKYRKKPVEVEAFKYKIDKVPKWFKNQIDRLIIENERNCIIKTLDGDMAANYGDYIIKGVNGEFYPRKPDIFEKTYEKVQ
ncbi:hypothetical protein [Clostridium niameyense]|uniref:hypothetical protein n=1 Tax=Clostridium niameyense TaxID=1622073 RepID=UPI00067EF131|nr:hypothetical protein [Clostridium niameyense]